MEGGEGSGKGTILDFLKEKLKGRSDVIFTREPGGTEYGEKIREALLSKEFAGKISVLSELFTFCTTRANHCDLLIRPALKRGKIVISDRFDQSTIAYQIFGRKRRKFEKIFRELNSIAKGKGISSEIKPDLIVFLDVSPEVGLKRANARKEKNTRFDDEALAFHKRVRTGYFKQSSMQKNWIRINANNPAERVKEDVWKKVKKII